VAVQFHVLSLSGQEGTAAIF